MKCIVQNKAIFEQQNQETRTTSKLSTFFYSPSLPSLPFPAFCSITILPADLGSSTFSEQCLVCCPSVLSVKLCPIYLKSNQNISEAAVIFIVDIVPSHKITFCAELTVQRTVQARRHNLKEGAKY